MPKACLPGEMRVSCAQGVGFLPHTHGGPRATPALLTSRPFWKAILLALPSWVLELLIQQLERCRTPVWSRVFSPSTASLCRGPQNSRAAARAEPPSWPSGHPAVPSLTNTPPLSLHGCLGNLTLHTEQGLKLINGFIFCPNHAESIKLLNSDHCPIYMLLLFSRPDTRHFCDFYTVHVYLALTTFTGLMHSIACCVPDPPSEVTWSFPWKHLSQNCLLHGSQGENFLVLFL